MTKTTDKLLYLTTAVAVLLALTSILWRVHARQPLPEYRAGESAEGLSEITSQKRRTLVVWADTRCSACMASVPFYVRVAEAAPSTPLVVMGRQTSDELRALFSEGNAASISFISVGSRPLKFRFTPTVLLIDSKGTIERVWTGRFATRKEEDELICLLD